MGIEIAETEAEHRSFSVAWVDNVIVTGPGGDEAKSKSSLTRQ